MFAAFFIVFTPPVHAQDIISDLVAYWKLDEAGGGTASDSSGNNINGGVAGAITWRPAGGKVDGALEVNTPAWDGFSAGHASLNALNNVITVSFWFKGTATADWQALIAKMDWGTAGWSFSTDDSTPYTAYIRIDTSAGTNQVPFSTPSDTFPSELFDGNWHHVGLFPR